MQEQIKEPVLLPEWEKVFQLFHPPAEITYQMSYLPEDTQKVLYESFIECGRDDILFILLYYKVHLYNKCKEPMEPSDDD